MREEGIFGERALVRHARILELLEAGGAAGLLPMNILVFHAFAYLCNVIAPVWDLPPLEGKVLKRRGGPFYPALQRDMDRLVGIGMVQVSGVTHVQDLSGRWRLEGNYDLNVELASDAVEFLHGLDDEQPFMVFAKEAAFALSALNRRELEAALVEDATYSDPSISYDNVLDFGEWAFRNPTANAANYFDALVQGRTRVTDGEKLHLYVRHLRWRLHAG